jgi:hypothetical protein
MGHFAGRPAPFPGGRLVARSAPCLGLLLLAAGCSDDGPTPPPPASLEPTACFTITPWVPQASCPYRVVWLFEASCSSDDSTAARDLRVRWDFDDDGVWDTPFGPAQDTVVFDPGPLGGVIGGTACQVRDTDGGLGIAVMRWPDLDLGPTPDIVAGAVSFETREPRELDVTSVRAGQEFAVDVFVTFHGVPAGRPVVIAVEKDGVPFATETATSFQHPCGGFGLGWYTVEEPGTYEFSVVLDADGRIPEADESNNRSSGVLVVVP